MKLLAPKNTPVRETDERPSSARTAGHDGGHPARADTVRQHRAHERQEPSAADRIDSASEESSPGSSQPRAQNALTPPRKTPPGPRKNTPGLDIKACDRWMRHTKTFCAPDFAVGHLHDALKKGLNLEIGGPTKAFRILGGLPIASGPNVTVSNVFADQGWAAHQEALLADGRSLPVRAGTFDSVWASALPDLDGIRSGAIKEAWRTLRPGGFFVWQGSTVQDMKEASDAGFQIAHYTFSRDKGSAEEIFLSADALGILRPLSEKQSFVEFQPYSRGSYSQSEPVKVLNGDFVFKKPQNPPSTR